MAMGCQCKDRICQRCVHVGDVRRCPSCRKPRRRRVVDRKWLKREWRNAPLEPCLGCHKAVYPRYLHKHEQRCVKYRDMFDALFHEDATLLRQQSELQQAAIADLESRVDAQSDTIEELSAHVEDMEVIIETQEEERRLYRIEQSRTIRAMDALFRRFTHMRHFLFTAERRHRAAEQEQQQQEQQQHQQHHQQHAIDVSNEHDEHEAEEEEEEDNDNDNDDDDHDDDDDHHHHFIVRHDGLPPRSPFPHHRSPNTPPRPVQVQIETATAPAEEEGRSWSSSVSSSTL
jgi:uncharacterized coiled-coil protein SlyX